MVICLTTLEKCALANEKTLEVFFKVPLLPTQMKLRELIFISSASSAGQSSITCFLLPPGHGQPIRPNSDLFSGLFQITYNARWK